MCTSMFTKSVWLNGYFDINFINSSENYTLPSTDFRSRGVLTFSNLVSLCLLASVTIEYAEAVFSTDELVTAQTLSRIYLLYLFCLVFYFFCRTRVHSTCKRAYLHVSDSYCTDYGSTNSNYSHFSHRGCITRGHALSIINGEWFVSDSSLFSSTERIECVYL